MNRTILALPAFLILAGCASTLTPEAEKIKLVSATQKKSCERVKLVTFNQRLGPDKPGNAMKGALNEAAVAGANAFYVVSTSADWAEGASVVGEALRCTAAQ